MGKSKVKFIETFEYEGIIFKIEEGEGMFYARSVDYLNISAYSHNVSMLKNHEIPLKIKNREFRVR
ncbi:MAG: hypothetical protein RR912_03730 [Clostridium sp.]